MVNSAELLVNDDQLMVNGCKWWWMMADQWLTVGQMMVRNGFLSLVDDEQQWLLVMVVITMEIKNPEAQS